MPFQIADPDCRSTLKKGAFTMHVESRLFDVEVPPDEPTFGSAAVAAQRQSEISGIPCAAPAGILPHAVGVGGLLAAFIGAILAGCHMSCHSEAFALPAAADIQRVDFGINLGATSTKWYRLPLSAGRTLTDVFRDSVAKKPSQTADVIDEIAPYEYSLRVVARSGKEFAFSFRPYANDVHPDGTWAQYSMYVFPANRIPLLRKHVQSILATNVIAGGSYAYRPGEDDRSHYSRIRNLIVSKIAPP
ncbi:MAG: hypothetical protein LLG00_06955 [Planctomycetaceae bacterium]|nr:hypothetical protein [Planctomycetaceae bacterium]